MVVFSCRFSTIFTMFPIFSLVMDKDVKESIVLTFPELYKDLSKVQFHFACNDGQ